MTPRLFTFGCSFTNYDWPTWADLLLTQVPGQNWGQCGMGNKFIFESLIECNVTNKITKDDTVIIMWSSWHREDRYIQGWKGRGNVYNSEPFYDKQFIQKYWDDKGGILHSMNWMAAAIQLLEGIGCRYTMAFLQFNPIIGLPTELINTDIIDISVFKKYSDFIAEYNDHFVYQDLWKWQPKYPEVEPVYWNVPWYKVPCVDIHPQPRVFYIWIERYLHKHITHLNIDLTKLKNIAEICDVGLHKTAPDYQSLIKTTAGLQQFMSNKSKYGAWDRI